MSSSSTVVLAQSSSEPTRWLRVVVFVAHGYFVPVEWRCSLSDPWRKQDAASCGNIAGEFLLARAALCTCWPGNVQFIHTVVSPPIWYKLVVRHFSHNGLYEVRMRACTFTQLRSRGHAYGAAMIGIFVASGGRRLRCLSAGTRQGSAASGLFFRASRHLLLTANNPRGVPAACEIVLGQNCGDTVSVMTL